MKKGEKIIYILVVSVVFCMYIGLMYIFISGAHTRKPQTTHPASDAFSHTSPTPKKGAQQQMIDSRKSLSIKEAQIKKQIIQRLNNQTGVAYKQKEFSVLYLANNDTFQVRILTNDLEGVKTKVLLWFSNQGFSHDGICSLIIDFHTTPQALQKNQQVGKRFNPFPEGC